MRAVVQRVARACVSSRDSGSDGPYSEVGSIDDGLVVFVGIGPNDTTNTAQSLARKIVGLRIFEDDDGKMNHDIRDVGGSLLAVSQFTLFGDCRKGRRPSFVGAGPPEMAAPLFDHFVDCVRDHEVICETGRFRTTMQVELLNQGPVTLLIDTDKTF
jgi:D-tyrosyl-tRNA(Tyr) deacylase